MADCDIGLVGLGTMGSALALNIAEKGFGIAVWNRNNAVTDDFKAGAGDLGAKITPTHSLESLVGALKAPRAIILMVPAGGPVDQMVAALRPLLDDRDLIIDAGNANFRETARRMAAPGAFLGIGVSGGAEGARHGPAIMGGGDRAHWARVAPILTAIAARYKGTPCATLFGPEGAGHFVKMVHNGIEYADMQMIAEIYGLMRDGLGRSASDIGAVFTRWNDGPLSSYLVQITGQVASVTDAATGGPLLDVIVDAAGQKGTGRWTAIEAQHLGAPIPVIEAAIAARNMSARREDRQAGAALFGAGPRPIDPEALPDDLLEAALICGKVLCYSQGFAMLAAAGREFGWDLALPEVARVWRAGCIIRSEMLDDMAAALADHPGQDLIFAPGFADLLRRTHDPLRQLVALAARHGIAVPALGAGLSFFDSMRSARGTANMIQGQRDFFGLHGFVRLDDGRSDQHGPWAGG